MVVLDAVAREMGKDLAWLNSDRATAPSAGKTTMARESLSLPGFSVRLGLAGLVFALLSGCLTVSCNPGGTTGPDPSDEIASVSISPPQVTIGIGEITTLTAVVRNENGDIVQTAVEWSSRAPDIAMVDADVGSVRGIAAGKATISATAGGITGNASVTVRLLALGFD